MFKPKVWSLSRMAKLSGKSLDDQIDIYVMPLAVSAVTTVNGRVAYVVVDGVRLDVHTHPTAQEFEDEMNRALDSHVADAVESVKKMIEERNKEVEVVVIDTGDRVMNKKGDLN